MRFIGQWFPEIIAGVLAIGSIVLPVLFSPSDQNFKYILSVEFTGLFVYLISDSIRTNIMLMRSERANLAIKDGAIDLALLRARYVSHAEFYKRLLSAVRSANSSIDLMAMQPTPPTAFGVPELKEYLNELAGKIEREVLVTRRIVSIPTLEKLEWVIELINTHKGCKKFALKYVDVSLLGTVSIPYPLNVQIVDKREIFIINPAKGYFPIDKTSEGIWLEDNGQMKIAEMFSDYYDAYWSMGEEIFLGGRVNIELLRQIAKKLDSQVIISEDNDTIELIGYESN